MKNSRVVSSVTAGFCVASPLQALGQELHFPESVCVCVCVLVFVFH